MKSNIFFQYVARKNLSIFEIDEIIKIGDFGSIEVLLKNSVKSNEESDEVQDYATLVTVLSTIISLLKIN